MAMPTGTSPLSNPSHFVLHAIHHNVKAYGAVGDDVTDDTAAFVAADLASEAVGGVGGGTLEVPAGVYRLDNFTPVMSGAIQGASQWATVLKAKAGAAAALTMSGLVHARVSDLCLDGNGKASKGLVVQGSATTGSQGHTFRNVRFRNSTVGAHVATGMVDQVDKNLWENCWWSDNTTGLWVDSVDGQGQLILSGSFDTHTTAIRLSHGGVTWIGGQVQAATTGILIDGGGDIERLYLSGVIMEGEGVSIDASTAFPSNGLIDLSGCVLQGSTATVIMGMNGSILRATGCGFKNGNINATGNDVVFYDMSNIFSLGAAWNPTGLVCRRVKFDLDGIHFNMPAAYKYALEFGGDGAAAMDTNLYWGGANILKTDDKFVTALGLGVGNSASASEVLGTSNQACTAKIQVFDAAGASLGYVPVYAGLT